jgi:hypothetical protein
LYDIENKLNGSVKCFKNCSKLNHLDIDCGKLGDEFFLDINVFLPNLRIIVVENASEITDQTLVHVSKLKMLKKFHFRRNVSSNKLITDLGVCELINTCESIEVIEFYARPNITHKTIEDLIALAEKKSRSNIEFLCGFPIAGDEAEFEPINLDIYVHKIPHNLQIDLNSYFQP